MKAQLACCLQGHGAIALTQRCALCDFRTRRPGVHRKRTASACPVRRGKFREINLEPRRGIFFFRTTWVRSP
jgi:hypothetical protein